tara:strand:- start:477 stop:1295 length:819 start_codon:yes stop_codon:yes gene_type:complete
MFMMRNILFYIILCFCFLSCGEYQKALKTDDFNYKYEKAVAYYEKQDFNRALPLFSELNTIMLGTSKMEEIGYYYAYCHYSIGENLIAASLFKRYVMNYPNSKHTEECSYMSAYCYYLESSDYSLDPGNTYRAINELQGFINQFSNSKRIVDCNQLIDELRSRLSKKAFENAKQYYMTENYKSAIISFDNLLIDFPSFKDREQVYYLIVKSSYLLAVNSVSAKVEERLKETLDVYEQFKDNYSTSSYLSELEDTYENTKKMLEELNKNKNEI